MAVSTLGVRREKTLFLQGYEELLRRVHPSHILCYGEPFQEMEGSVLTIPYAQTNHLGTAKKAAPAPYYIKWTTGHVIGTDAPLGGFLPTETEPREFPEKGMGRAGRAAAIGAAAAATALGVAAIATAAPKTIPNSEMETISPYELQKTHSQTLNEKHMKNLVNDIKENGMKNPVKYVEYNGKKYIVDGHHRALASKKIGLSKIPVERVELPYKGYKNIQDLLWID